MWTTADHFLVPVERQGMEWGNSGQNHSCYRQNVHVSSMHSSLSQTECLAVEKMGFCRSSLFLAGVFQSSCKESIPYVSGGVVFLGHSLYFPPSFSSNSMALILCGISMPPTTNIHCHPPLNTPSPAEPPLKYLRAEELLGHSVTTVLFTFFKGCIKERFLSTDIDI